MEVSADSPVNKELIMENETYNDHQQALVSCICITHKRPEQLLKAILNFKDQTYLHKELIISYPKDDIPTKDLIRKASALYCLKIMTIERDQEVSVGAAKNIAVSMARGEYICIWDDDDYHAPNRLHHQMYVLQITEKSYQASILLRITLYDHLTQRANLSLPYNWSGTLLCSTPLLLQHPYEDTNLLEDINLIRFLESENLLLHIEYAFILYIYVYHGNNALDYHHFRYFMKNSFKFTDKYNKTVQQILNEREVPLFH